jgi:LPS export ABC transporter protein LptC
MPRIIPATIMAGMLFSCTNDLDRVAAIEIPLAAPDRITFEAEYLMTDSGRLRNILQAGRIEEWSTADPPRTELMEDLRLSFFDSIGDPGSILTARRGIILPNEKRMEVYEDVVFVNVRGERLETEHLVWLQDSARVRTDRPVRVQRGHDVIHGIGLDADQDFSRYTIHRITGELHVAEDDTLAP